MKIYFKSKGITLEKNLTKKEKAKENCFDFSFFFRKNNKKVFNQFNVFLSFCRLGKRLELMNKERKHIIDI